MKNLARYFYFGDLKEWIVFSMSQISRKLMMNVVNKQEIP